MVCWSVLLVAGAGPGLGPPAQAETIRVGPSDDWCRAINRAGPGDRVLLAPGRYARPCEVRASGAPGRPLVIASANPGPGRRAALRYAGRGSNVIDLRGVRHVVIRALDFAHTREAVDAVKIHRSSDVTVEGCRFEDIGGISVSAVSGSSRRITVRDNVLRDLRATGMYFGCHDGEGCQASEIVVERNLIRGVDAPEGAVGYGVQVKLNSEALIRDNTVYDTKGPGIMVYGSNRGGPPSVVEGNYVAGSRRDGGIVVGGGPAVVRNNVAAGNARAGILAQDYQQRGLQSRVWIVHNTVLDNAEAGIWVQSWSPGAGNVLANNAIAPSGEGLAMRPEAPEGTVQGNVLCWAPTGCFVEVGQPPYDLRPRPGGALASAGGVGEEPWRPETDFMGRPRGRPADAGALEWAAGGLVLGGGAPRPARVD